MCGAELPTSSRRRDDLLLSAVEIPKPGHGHANGNGLLLLLLLLLREGLQLG
jgi:hypothetical protein